MVVQINKKRLDFEKLLNLVENRMRERPIRSRTNQLFTT